MALTVTKIRSTVVGSDRVERATVTFDSSYPTGGESIAASDFETLTALTHVDVVTQDEDGAEVVTWDRSAGTLKVFTADGTEAGNGSDQSGVVVEVNGVGY